MNNVNGSEHIKAKYPYAKWEYKTVSKHFADLNSLGGEGWELCAVQSDYYIFKRHKIGIDNIIEITKKENQAVVPKLNHNIKVGDWIIAIDKDGKYYWDEAFLVARVVGNTVYIWYHGTQVDYILNSNIRFAVDNTMKRNKSSYDPALKKVKKVNPNNPNNIKKGDWVFNAGNIYAYKVHSVKNGKLLVFCDGKICDGWDGLLTTICKAKQEDFESGKKAKAF